MKNDEFTTNQHEITNHFADTLQHLLSGQKLDLYAEGLDSIFEIVAVNLLAEIPARKSL